MTAKHEKKPCSICGKEISVQYITSHQRMQHGVRGGRTGIVRRSPREMEELAAANLPEVVSPKILNGALRNHKPSFKVMPFMVLEDQDGGLWLAERIK